jgi:hypothetical protein
MINGVIRVNATATVRKQKQDQLFIFPPLDFHHPLPTLTLGGLYFLSTLGNSFFPFLVPYTS